VVRHPLMEAIGLSILRSHLLTGAIGHSVLRNVKSAHIALITFSNASPSRSNHSVHIPLRANRLTVALHNSGTEGFVLWHGARRRNIAWSVGMNAIAGHRIRELAPNRRTKKKGSDVRQVEATPARPALQKALKPFAAAFGATLGLGIALTGAQAQFLGPTLEDFAVLAGTTVTNTGPSVISGSVGVSPGSAIVGFPPGIVLPPGTIHAGNAVAAQAQAELTAAYNALQALPSQVNLTGQNAELQRQLDALNRQYQDAVKNVGVGVALPVPLTNELQAFAKAAATPKAGLVCGGVIATTTRTKPPTTARIAKPIHRERLTCISTSNPCREKVTY